MWCGRLHVPLGERRDPEPCVRRKQFNIVHRCCSSHSKLMGSWCSGITSAPHAEGPGFKSQWVQYYERRCRASSVQYACAQVCCGIRSSTGSWCSGITSAPHAEGPGFKSQWVQFKGAVAHRACVRRVRVSRGGHRPDVSKSRGPPFSRVRLRRPVRMGLPPAAPDCRGVVVGRPVVGAWFGRGLAGFMVGCVRDLGGSIRGSVIPWLPLVGSLAWANARQGFGGRLREPRPSFASSAR